MAGDYFLIVCLSKKGDNLKSLYRFGLILIRNSGFTEDAQEVAEMGTR